MDQQLLKALARQLDDASCIIFYHEARFYHLYDSEQANYGYDVYVAMDEYEPYDGGTLDIDTAEEAILAIIK